MHMKFQNHWMSAYLMLESLLLLLLLLLLHRPNYGFVPRPCIVNLTHSAAQCCPTPPGHSQPCGFPALGNCVTLPPSKDPVPHKLHRVTADFRLTWPTRLFRRVCECHGRRFGADCGDCWFGFEGPDCSRRVLRLRK